MHRMYNDPQMVRAMSRARTVPFPIIQSCVAFTLPAVSSRCNLAPCSAGTPSRACKRVVQSQHCARACCTLFMLLVGAMQVQRCTLLSIKTGGCPETCNYCAQSSSWSKETKLKAEKLMDLDAVYEVGRTLCVAASVTDLGLQSMQQTAPES